jgi:hypothetical protein
MLKVIKIYILMLLFSTIVIAEIPSDEHIFDEFMRENSSSNTPGEADNSLKAVVIINGEAICVIGDKIIEDCTEKFE